MTADPRIAASNFMKVLAEGSIEVAGWLVKPRVVARMVSLNSRSQHLCDTESCGGVLARQTAWPIDRFLPLCWWSSHSRRRRSRSRLAHHLNRHPSAQTALPLSGRKTILASTISGARAEAL